VVKTRLHHTPGSSKGGSLNVTGKRSNNVLCQCKRKDIVKKDGKERLDDPKRRKSAKKACRKNRLQGKGVGNRRAGKWPNKRRENAKQIVVYSTKKRYRGGGMEQKKDEYINKMFGNGGSITRDNREGAQKHVSFSKDPRGNKVKKEVHTTFMKKTHDERRKW